MTNTDRVTAYLQQIAPTDATNDQIRANTGIRSHQNVFQITSELRKRGIITGVRHGHEWRFWFGGPTDRSARVSHGVTPVIEPARLRNEIRSFYGAVLPSPHHRYRSWEHCFQYFHKMTPAEMAADRNHAALQLGFYLASWGMYRGSSFLLQHTYTIHLEVIDRLGAPEFSALWKREFGATDDDFELVPLILRAIETIRAAYAAYGRASDTLVTKILLGTFGCLPACDQYFVRGFKRSGFSFSYVNSSFIERVLQFCIGNIDVLRDEQHQIRDREGVSYPLMKLIDMYFWQSGGGNPESIVDE